MKINILGHDVEVLEVSDSQNKICRRSGDDHLKLKFEARAARQAENFNVEESHVLCTRCGLAIELK